MSVQRVGRAVVDVSAAGIVEGGPRWALLLLLPLLLFEPLFLPFPLPLPLPLSPVLGLRTRGEGAT
jgi:hypothetical protein